VIFHPIFSRFNTFHLSRLPYLCRNPENMKYIAFLFASALLISSCGNNDGKPAGDSVKTDSVAVTYFGDKITPEGAVPAAQIKEKLAHNDSLAMKVEGKIVDVCQKKGCWMELELANGESMRVTFKDYGFFVPKDAGGKTVIMDGYAYNDTTTVAQLRHYAEDGGKSKEEIDKITEPEVAVSFEAHGVIIKN
jgi:hypothetical protein